MISSVRWPWGCFFQSGLMPMNFMIALQSSVKSACGWLSSSSSGSSAQSYMTVIGMSATFWMYFVRNSGLSMNPCAAVFVICVAIWPALPSPGMTVVAAAPPVFLRKSRRSMLLPYD